MDTEDNTSSWGTVVAVAEAEVEEAAVAAAAVEG